MRTPQAKDWDHFWKKNLPARKLTRQAGRPGDSSRISWSKKRILSVIKPYVIAGKNILDAGCGSGFFAHYFQGQGLNAWALDYSDSALAATKGLTQGRVKLIKSDLAVEGLKEKLNLGIQFDVIFSDGLLEHFLFKSQGIILKNFKGLLYSQGTLITFVPNRFSPWEIIRPCYMPGIEERPFILKELIGLHSQQGLEIIKAGGINVFPFRLSPENWFGSNFGMLLFVVARKK